MSKVTVYEVGPRDGIQNEAHAFDIENKIELVSRLIEAGSKNIEVGAFVSPKWVPQMEDSKDVMVYFGQKQNIGLLPKKVNLVTLVPNLQGLETAMNVDAKSVAVFIAASESFSKKNTNATIKESLEIVKSVLEVAKKKKK